MKKRGSKTARTAAYANDQWESLEFWAHTVAHREVYEERARKLGLTQDRDSEYIHGAYQIAYVARQLQRAGIKEPELAEIQIVGRRFARMPTLTATSRREVVNFGANVLAYARAHRLQQNPAPTRRKKTRGTRHNPPSEIANPARVAYRLTHWGHGGKGKTRPATYADPTGPMAEIGELIAVEYRTSKLGDPKGSTYRHEFGPRGRPRLAFNTVSRRLAIADGRGRMRTKGITG